jgi:phosphohistidine phosphatase SixA
MYYSSQSKVVLSKIRQYERSVGRLLGFGHWPLPSHWQAHFFGFNNDIDPFDGSSKLEYNKVAQLMD